MTLALLIAGGLFVLVYGPLALLAWQRPLLARLAWRESVRRRGQLALLVGGLLIGSASITASMVAADSGSESRVLDVYRRWGMVDLTITARNGHFFTHEVANRLAADATLQPYVDGVQAGVEFRASVADLDQRLARLDVLVVGFDPAAQRPFGAYMLSDGRGTLGDELSAGDLLLSKPLATALEAHVGERVRLTAGFPGDTTEFRVAGIASSRGPGAYSPLAVFAPLATTRLLTQSDDISVVRVSARGSLPADLDSASRAAAPLRSAVSRLNTATPLSVTEAKVAGVKSQEKITQAILAQLLGISSLTVAAAVVLIVNLMLALAEERRPRLAILRALGLTRTGLIALSLLEGAIYSLAAATVGIGVGILAGWPLGARINYFVMSDPAFEQVLSLKPATLAVAFSTGALITLVTVAAAAYRTSRMAIAAAVRELPEPASLPRGQWLLRAAPLALALAGAAALVQSNALVRLGGGVVLIVAGASVMGGRVPERWRATITGFLLAGWAGLAVGSNSDTSDMTKYMAVFILGLLVVVFGLCIAAAANLSIVEASVGLAGARLGRLHAALRPPVAYLSRRPVRTGLSMGAFALVLVLVTMLAVMVYGYRPAYARDSAGYDIKVVSPGSGLVQLPPEIQQQVAAQATIPMRVYFGPIRSQEYGPNGDAVIVRFYVFSDEVLDNPPVYLGNRDTRFASANDVWQALRRDPSLVVMGAVTPGADVVIQGLQGPLHLHVAGGQGVILDGIVASASTLAQIDTIPAGTTLLLKTRPGADPQAVAHEIERSLFAQGVTAVTTRELLDQGYQENLGWLTIYDVLLEMGLLVGVLSLAVIGIRAAVERRRAIGIMRALGYQPPRLLAGLVAEATITASIGVVIGVGAGAVMGYLVMRLIVAGGSFGIDGVRLGLALAIVYGTALGVTAALAWRASHMAPAEAIRHTG